MSILAIFIYLYFHQTLSRKIFHGKYNTEQLFHCNINFPRKGTIQPMLFIICINPKQLKFSTKSEQEMII